MGGTELFYKIVLVQLTGALVEQVRSRLAPFFYDAG